MPHTFLNSSKANELMRLYSAQFFRRKSRPNTGHGSAIAISYPAIPGSLGDEAMCEALNKELRSTGCNRLGLITHDSNSNLNGFDEVQLRPGKFAFSWWSFCRWLARYDALGLMGADVIDGYYSARNSLARLHLIDCAHRMGLRTVLLGFSYRADPEPKVLAELKNIGDAVTLLARDPMSLERVRSLTGQSPIQVADLAFLLQGTLSSARVNEARRWIETEKAQGNKVVGLNCNPQSLGSDLSYKAHQLAGNYAKAAASLARTDSQVRFLIVPHDCRGDFSDVDAAHHIWNSMDGNTRQKTRLIGETWTASEIKGIAGLLDYSITGRMHFAIACLGSGVPAVSLTYQDKFEGLYQHFELDGMCIKGSDGLSLERLIKFFNHIHRLSDASRNKVLAMLPHVNDLARRNITALVGEPIPSE